MQTTVKMMRFTQKSRLVHPFFFNICGFLVPTIGHFYVGKIKRVLAYFGIIASSCHVL